MTDDELVTLGSFCETLLCSDAWRVITEQFEQQCFQHMMSTDTHEKNKREGIYSTFQGFRDFQSHMKAIIAQKEQLLKPDQLPDWAPQTADLED